MDLGLSEEQEMLRNFARDFLEKECPETLVRAMEDDEKGHSPELWQKMAQQGWQGLIIPEKYGGHGMTLALTDPSARWDADGVQLAAKAEGDSFVLNGTKLFVPDAHVSDYMLVAARTKQSANPEDGVTLLLVDSKRPGIDS